MDIDQLSQEQTQKFNLKDYLWVCISKWYLFVIALVITVGYAFYYLAKTENEYVAKATLMFKDDTSSKTGDISQVFSDIEGFNINANLSNEMLNLKSPINMTEVVRRLGLDINYSFKNGLRTQVLYGTDLPLTVRFLDLGENRPASMKIAVNDNGEVTLSDFSNDLEGKKLIDAAPMKVKAADVATDTLSTPLGRMLIQTNETFENKPANIHSPITVQRVGVSSAVSQFIGGLSTEFESMYSSAIHITQRDVNKERAKAILDGVIAVYSENWIADRNQISIATSNFINERLGVIETELGDVDTDISSYKSEHQLTNVDAASQAFFNRSLEASENITQLSTMLAHARTVRDHLSNIANSYNVLPAVTGLNNSSIEGQIVEYNKKLIERNNLLANSSTENPVIADMDNMLAAMRQSILSAIDSYITTINTNIRATQATQGNAASRLAANPYQARYLLSVERQQKVKESLYLYLLQKREENELSQAFTAYNFRVVTPPYAYGPVAPIPSRIYLIYFVLGILIPGALIFLKEIINTSVRGRRDFETLTIPFVGEIPFTGKQESRLKKLFRKKKVESSPSHIVVRSGHGSVINEAFRVIRTNLEFMVPMGIDTARVLMMTSANPGSGKTFITLNLGAVLALKGKRVALLDLDLRKASLSETAGSPAIGLSSYLTGQVEADDIVVKNLEGAEGLDLYPVGPIPPNPAELLYSNRLVELVNTVKGKYDYVLIDCPPVEMVADAKIINRLADLTIFIIRAGLLDRAMLPEIQGFYNNKRYKSMSIILNGTPDTSTSVLRRANRYGYGYGYGYGYPQKKK